MTKKASQGDAQLWKCDACGSVGTASLGATRLPRRWHHAKPDGKVCRSPDVHAVQAQTKVVL